jgi:hypothetical protein
MWAANILLTLIGLVLISRMGREGATQRGGDLREMLDMFRGLWRLPFRRVRVTGEAA